MGERMSTAYDLHCVDCNAGLGLECYDSNELARVRSKRNTLAALSVLVASLDGIVRAEHSYLGHIDLGFFERHRDHNIRIVDEYGAYVGDCRERVECECCGTRVHCRLPHAHEGEHSPWSKEEKEVRDKKGRAIPWEPKP